MSHLISLTSAAALTAAFRTDKENLLTSTLQNQNVLPKCETFARAEIDDILAQSGCTQLRIYYGLDSNSKVHALLVGANSEDEDILNNGNDVCLVLQNAKRCPTDCPPSSSLNS